jgi:hypothetical protein
VSPALTSASVVAFEQGHWKRPALGRRSFPVHPAALRRMNEKTKTTCMSHGNCDSHRPKTTGSGSPQLVRMHDGQITAIDDWRKKTDLSRPEAIRRLVEFGLKTKGK